MTTHSQGVGQREIPTKPGHNIPVLDGWHKVRLLFRGSWAVVEIRTHSDDRRVVWCDGDHLPLEAVVEWGSRIPMPDDEVEITVYYDRGMQKFIAFPHGQDDCPATTVGAKTPMAAVGEVCRRVAEKRR